MWRERLSTGTSLLYPTNRPQFENTKSPVMGLLSMLLTPTALRAIGSISHVPTGPHTR